MSLQSDRTTKVKEIFDLLIESQYWSIDRLQEYQRQQLQQLLTHARATVPFYNNRLDHVFDADGTIRWDDWQSIPVLTRQEVSDNFDSLASTAPLAEHGRLYEASSSGSTGHPVKVLGNDWMSLVSAACNWRANTWAQLDWSSNLVGVFGPIAAPEGSSVGPWGPPWLASAQKGRHIYTTYDTNNIVRLAIMQHYGARYFAATPSNAVILAAAAEANRVKLKLDKILTRGNKATVYEISEIKRVFDADVIELYSSKECGAIAHPCPSGNGWHANAEAVLLEVLNDDDQPVPPGQEGRAVITAFGMTAFPLIRYDQGDRIVQGSSCDCGRTLPHFHAISGRVRDNFLRPNGEVIPDLSITARYALGAGRWQVAKVGAHDYEVRYVYKDWNQPIDHELFHRLFRETFYEQAKVKVIQVNDLELSARGKFKERVIEWQG